MKNFAIGLIVAGAALFVAGTFNVFYLSSKSITYLVWLSIPLIFMGIGLTAFILYQESKADRKEKRQNLEPSRKLIYALIGAWLLFSIASLVVGYSIGRGKGYQRGQTLGHQAGYQKGLTAGGKEAIQESYDQDLAEGYRRGKVDLSSYSTAQLEEIAKGKIPATGLPVRDWRDDPIVTPIPKPETSFEEAYDKLTSPKPDFLTPIAESPSKLTDEEWADVEKALGITEPRPTKPKISISTGTTAEEVRKYLGTPDRVERYDTGKYQHISDPAPCWVYGDVRIYFDGYKDYSSVTHWQGDLKSLLDKKLGSKH